jgi:hypothetical protein
VSDGPSIERGTKRKKGRDKPSLNNPVRSPQTGRILRCYHPIHRRLQRHDSVIVIVSVAGDRTREVFLGGHEEGGDGSRLVPVSVSEAGAAENCLGLVSMLVEGVAEEDDVYMASLMLALVVLFGFDRRCARRNRWALPYPAYSEFFSSGYRRCCDLIPPNSRALEELVKNTTPGSWLFVVLFYRLLFPPWFFKYTFYRSRTMSSRIPLTSR